MFMLKPFNILIKWESHQPMMKSKPIWMPETTGIMIFMPQTQFQMKQSKDKQLKESTIPSTKQSMQLMRLSIIELKKKHWLLLKFRHIRILLLLRKIIMIRLLLLRKIIMIRLHKLMQKLNKKLKIVIILNR